MASLSRACFYPLPPFLNPEILLHLVLLQLLTLTNPKLFLFWFTFTLTTLWHLRIPQKFLPLFPWKIDYDFGSFPTSLTQVAVSFLNSFFSPPTPPGEAHILGSALGSLLLEPGGSFTHPLITEFLLGWVLELQNQIRHSPWPQRD